MKILANAGFSGSVLVYRVEWHALTQQKSVSFLSFWPEKEGCNFHSRSPLKMQRGKITIRSKQLISIVYHSLSYHSLNRQTVYHSLPLSCFSILCRVAVFYCFFTPLFIGALSPAQSLALYWSPVSLSICSWAQSRITGMSWTRLKVCLAFYQEVCHQWNMGMLQI